MGPDVLQGAYIARLDLAAPHLAGVSRKIEAQRAALARAGFPTRLHSIHSGAIMCDSDVLRPAANGSVGRRMTHYNYFWRDTLSAVADADFLYIRFQGAGPGLLKMLSKFRRQRPEVPILMEIPTYPYKDERRGVRQHLLGMVDDMCAPFLKHYVDRIVTFSSRNMIMGVSTIRTQNGVDVSKISVRPENDSHKTLRLVGVANFAFWHGYDRVIEGLAQLEPTMRVKIAIDFIGSGSELESLKTLARVRNVNEEICFHGPLSGSSLDQIMARTHIGIGCLGLHRVTKETSDLKSREYCARGMPFLADKLENDFQAVAGFVHVSPEDDSPIDLIEVFDWYQRIRSEDRAATLRAHAEKHLSWDAKMEPVVAWMRRQIKE
tara:strand:- start:610 stop:1743 length:1134 start_codon:yes stop_codon:yes gene_type:complete